MNTGATLEQSTAWSRFLSWLLPVKAVAPASEPPSTPEVAAPAPEVAAPAPEVAAPAPEVAAPAPPVESGKTIQIPLESTPLDVQTTNVEQQSKNDKSEEQPNPSASSAKSQSKKKKRH